MSLGQFVKQSRDVMSDRYQAKFAADNNRALLVWVREYKTNLKTEYAKQGDGEGIVVDLIDLAVFSTDPEGSVKCNVLWMGSAVRDQFKPYVGTGQPLPIKLVWQEGGSFGRYIAPEPLDDQWLQYAEGVYAKYPAYVDDIKAKKMAQWQAEQAAAGVPQPQPQVPAIPALTGPQPQAQAPAAAPSVPQQAPVAQPPVQAPPVAAPPVQAPAMSAAPVAAAPQPPAAPPTAPQFNGATPPAAPAAAPPLQDQDVNALLARLNQS